MPKMGSIPTVRLLGSGNADTDTLPSGLLAVFTLRLSYRLSRLQNLLTSAVNKSPSL